MYSRDPASGFTRPSNGNMVLKIRFRFYGRLNDFLRLSQKGRAFEPTVEGKPGLLDIAQALGVPHTEVGKIVASGRKRNFLYRIKEEDQIQIWPQEKFRSHNLKFILDVHLGKLAKYLRLFGFDTLYRNDYSDREIIRQAGREKRFILTRDVGLLKVKEVSRGYGVRKTDPQAQLREVLTIFRLYSRIRPFRFCLECNGRLVPVKKKEIASQLLPGTEKYFQRFRRCLQCQKIYWPGSHYQKMERFIQQVGFAE